MKILLLAVCAFFTTFYVYGQRQPSWTKDFKKLQKAMQSQQVASIKPFISFPIKSKDNRIWTFIYGAEHGKYQPFTVEDFDTYAGKIFPSIVYKAIIGIDIERLFEKGNFTSAKIQVAQNYAYVSALYYSDKQTCTIEIATFNYPLYEADETPSEEDLFQINYTYYFQIEGGKNIRIVDMEKLHLD